MLKHMNTTNWLYIQVASNWS